MREVHYRYSTAGMEWVVTGMELSPRAKKARRRVKLVQRFANEFIFRPSVDSWPFRCVDVECRNGDAGLDVLFS